ncbi:expressed hypothetical protein [Trichoplax adhaerens]|uniref:Thioredoxin n=1 Tax=Trichoplax adhaerens TaxID=10228 RepID=B3SC05_TRIAD|nr:expressed hypothetical protein [Trichoplax adhaerens]EDV19765.1 expressed hypothetical protein [Trichoplax adhaerens]|eukprot:XP_002117789.1 expressed hypothetical protein [Trichoplax adhaerens]
MVQVIETKEAFDKFLSDAKDKLVVFDFFATWCQPCKLIGPIFEKMSESDEYKDVVFAKIDVDENEETAEFVGIRAMPTFAFYKNGSKIDEVSGAAEDRLRSKIQLHM